MFSLFLQGLESCEPLFDDLGLLFLDFETWKGVLCLDWKGFFVFDSEAVIKSAASAVSLTAWELHGSARRTARQADGGRPGCSHATPKPSGRLR